MTDITSLLCASLRETGAMDDLQVVILWSALGLILTMLGSQFGLAPELFDALATAS